jgi:hypothetical protein
VGDEPGFIWTSEPELSRLLREVGLPEVKPGIFALPAGLPAEKSAALRELVLDLRFLEEGA